MKRITTCVLLPLFGNKVTLAQITSIATSNKGIPFISKGLQVRNVYANQRFSAFDRISFWELINNLILILQDAVSFRVHYDLFIDI